MIANIGNIFIGVGLTLSFYSFVMSFVGEKNSVSFLKKSSLLSFHLGTLALVAASLTLIWAFLGNHFEIEYVFYYSSTHEPFLYKLAAFYAGRDGSLLLWAVVLSISSTVFLWELKRRSDPTLGKVLLVLAFVQLFFNATLFFKSNPFASLDFTPANGRGLNPLLENFYMVVHPPALYLGFIFFTVPFASAVISLYNKGTTGVWVEKTRGWIILAWFFLGLGNVLGSYWAYIELGWGGYWAWDPVENASLIPWLVSTALLHSILVEKRTRMFRVWNYALMFMTFISTIVATFLTRSGIVESVHAFAQSEIGNYFLAFILVVFIGSFGLLLARQPSAEKERTIQAYTSREASLLVINIMFTFSAFAVLLGTLMPTISQVLVGRKITLEIPYYSRIFSVFGLVLLLMLGICPLLSWRKSFKGFTSFKFLGYVVVTALCAGIAVLLDVATVRSVLSYSLAGGAVFTAVFCLYEKVAAKREGSGDSPGGLSWPTLKRYAGMIAHIGVILMFFGITGTADKVEDERIFNKGEQYYFGDYKVVNNGFKFLSDKRKEMVFSVFDLYKGKEKLTEVKPAKFFYAPTLKELEPQVTTEMGVYSTLKEDLLIVLLGFDLKQEQANVKLIRNPLINWIWIGSAVLFAATLIVIAPFGERRKD